MLKLFVLAYLADEGMKKHGHRGAGSAPPVQNTMNPSCSPSGTHLIQRPRISHRRGGDAWQTLPASWTMKAELILSWGCFPKCHDLGLTVYYPLSS